MRRHARYATRALIAFVAMLGLGGCAHIVMLHDPLDANEHNDLGVAYETGGQAKLASHEYHRSLRLDHHQARTWVNLGNVQAAGGHWRAAEKSYRRALRDSSTDTDAMNNLAIALHRQGRLPAEAHTLAACAVATGGERDSVYRATLAEVDGGRQP